ncbi:hypothetical protein M8C13_37245 [Crossiella sp. SN42]|uniref:hypothetical protein n=1 Tax=Crossiella sp. SN42 TaxID=2944808 RepID=UPI00207C9052|nr:hypothetical protein [Crossiella sp. SN42]MCO1581411.1 hypothetical protein [Crossiella sp. SN42]
MRGLDSVRYVLLGHTVVAWLTAGVLWARSAFEFPFAMATIMTGAIGLVLALLLPAYSQQLRTSALWFTGILIPLNLALAALSASSIAGAVLAAVAFALLLRPLPLPFRGYPRSDAQVMQQV